METMEELFCLDEGDRVTLGSEGSTKVGSVSVGVVRMATNVIPLRK